jgi:hypothetical protein
MKVLWLDRTIRRPEIKTSVLLRNAWLLQSQVYHGCSLAADLWAFLEGARPPQQPPLAPIGCLPRLMHSLKCPFRNVGGPVRSRAAGPSSGPWAFHSGVPPWSLSALVLFFDISNPATSWTSSTILSTIAHIILSGSPAKILLLASLGSCRQSLKPSCRSELPSFPISYGGGLHFILSHLLVQIL